MARRSIRAFLVIALTSGVVMFGVGPAHGCSCGPLNPWNHLQEADGAFVGRLMDVDRGLLGFLSFGGQATYAFDIDVAIKGELGDSVDVRASADGASCGIEAAKGRRTGLFLYKGEAGQWTSSLCSQVDADLLLRAARPFPEPDGRGPIRYLLGGDLGPIRLMVLDDRGRTLAYGESSPGYSLDLEVRPGGGRFLESAALDSRGVVVVRDTSSLMDVHTFELTRARSPSVYQVDCLRADGRSFIAIEGRGRGWYVHVVMNGRHEVLFGDPAQEVFIDDRRVFVSRTGTLWELDIVTGRLLDRSDIPPHADGA